MWRWVQGAEEMRSSKGQATLMLTNSVAQQVLLAWAQCHAAEGTACRQQWHWDPCIMPCCLV